MSLLRVLGFFYAGCALVLAAGCAAGQPAAEPGGSGPPPIQVERLVFAVQPPSYESNDIRHLGTPDEWVLDSMYESMLGIDAETGKVTPVLATEWKIDPVNYSVRYFLRKGVRFHNDWGEFTAKDVVVKMREKVREEEAAARSSISAYWRGLLKEVEVVNDYEVVYHLKGPSGLILDYSSDQLGGAAIFSAAHFAKIGVPTMQSEALAGTGSYQFESRAQGQYIRFKKVPYQHWRVNAEFPAFEFRFIKESSTRLAGLLAGEIHMTNLPQDLQKQAELQGMKSIRGRVPARRAYMTFYCCQFKDVKDFSQGYIDPTSPLTDQRVRRALSKAINHDELNQALFGGEGERMVNNPLHPTRPGWDPSWERRWQDQYGYDPAAARRLLQEAGYTASNPLTVNLPVVAVNEVPNAEDVAEAIANYWRAIGINVVMRSVEAGQFSTQSRLLQLTNDVAVNGTSSNIWVGIYNNGSSLLHRSPGPEQPEVDEVLVKIRDSMDLEKHDAYWREVGEKLFVANHFIPLFWLPTTATVNPRVVSDYVFPGSISGSWTHTENIKAAR